MKYGIIADVHSNLEAFKAVLDAMKGIEKFIYAGDIVGYGADPNACIDLLRSLNVKAVAGNHDKAVSDDVGIGFYRGDIIRSINWTKSVITKDNMQYLRDLPEHIEEQGYEIVHGSLRSPLDEYITGVDVGAINIDLQKRKLCFVGHLHVPLYIFKNADGTYDGGHLADGDKLGLSKPEAAVINVGSIGQPRDNDPRASFGIYDTEKNTLQIKKIAYDIDAAQKKIRKAKLPDFFAERLRYGR